MSMANALRCDECRRPCLCGGETAEHIRALAARAGWKREGLLDICKSCAVRREEKKPDAKTGRFSI